MILFHCEVSHHSTSVKVQYGCLAHSPSISGAVVRRHWLQFYIQFISLLIAYSSLLAAAVLCLMPCALPSFLECCSIGSANPLYWVLLTPTACLLFLLFCCFRLLQLLLYNDVCYVCWDSLSVLCMLG